MKVKILETGLPPTEREVDEVQQAMGGVLPADLRRFWLAFDGARFETNEFKVKGLVGRSGIDRAIPVAEVLSVKGRSGLRDMTHFLPIGAAPCGDYVFVYLNPADAAFGSLWFFDHERALTAEDLLWISPGLTAFLEDLQPFLGADEVRATPAVVLKAWIDPSLKT
jgi:hypothetical protein